MLTFELEQDQISYNLYTREAFSYISPKFLQV